jgi:glutathione synthase/RimK-type ligase-like ATP-grasp enzyme
LTSKNLPVPETYLITENDEPTRPDLILALLGTIVVKPVNGERGAGVSVSITTLEQLTAALAKAKLIGSRVLIQKHVVGRQFRVTFLRDRWWFSVELKSSTSGPINLATGAIIHPAEINADVIATLIPLVGELRLHCVGIDLIMPDPAKTEYYVLELNSAPMFLEHRALDFVKSLFSDE